MLKYYLLIVFFSLIAGVSQSQSPAAADTITTAVDSSLSVRDSNAADTGTQLTVQTGEDSVYLPIADSLFLDFYKPRLVPVAKLNKWKADPDYQYANDPAYWKKENIQPDDGSFWNFFHFRWVQWIFFIVVALVILLGIYMLARENNLKWFLRKTKDSVLTQTNSSASYKTNYEEAISENENRGNYRIAVRYLYLRLIHSVREKNKIPVRDSTTNAEMAEAFGVSPLAGEFRYLARAYEYVYYGDFFITGELFRDLKFRFESFQLKIDS